jgi:hypothetical protein
MKIDMRASAPTIDLPSQKGGLGHLPLRARMMLRAAADLAIQEPRRRPLAYSLPPLPLAGEGWGEGRWSSRASFDPAVVDAAALSRERERESLPWRRNSFADLEVAALYAAPLPKGATEPLPFTRVVHCALELNTRSAP